MLSGTILRLALYTTAIAACATTPARDPTLVRTQTRIQVGSDIERIETDVRAVRDERTVAAPMVRVFDQLPAAYRALGVKTVAVVDTMRGVYTVGVRNLLLYGRLGGRPLSAYLDCGMGAMNMATADRSNVYFTATTYLTPSGTGGTIAHTLVAAEARDPAANTPAVRCVSTGAFEGGLAEELARLSAG